MKPFYLFLLFFTVIFRLEIFADQPQSCLILLDCKDTENIGRSFNFYLTTKLQSAVTEKSTPILMHASIWNSFIERRTIFEQNARREGTEEHRLFALYENIRDQLSFWSNYYNEHNEDIIQNKTLVAQRINEEFYIGDHCISDSEYQLLLNTLTHLDPDDWISYKKNGFFLLIPKNYLSEHPITGFKTDSLEKLDDWQDIALNYFESQQPSSLVDILPDIFLTHSDCPGGDGPKWNIALSGHGGSRYAEKDDGKKISWSGEPLIADLTLEEFKGVLDFFQTQVHTHSFHYSSCYAGGNHIELAFDKSYDFAVICECLTDCVSFCKWTNLLPSEQKKFLALDDLRFDARLGAWTLNTSSLYNWKEFFNSISKIDFSPNTIDYLPKALSYISHPFLANISLLRRPEASRFFPLTSSDTIKVDDQLIKFEKEKKTTDEIRLNHVSTLLIESDHIDCPLILNNVVSPRLISIKPGTACHYIRKLVVENPINFPNIFWQAEFQIYDKIFLIDECLFPLSEDSALLKSLKSNHSNVAIEKVLVRQQNTFFGHFLRLFFTIGDEALMVVAKNSDLDEREEGIAIQEVITLSKEAKTEYEQLYLNLKPNLPPTCR